MSKILINGSRTVEGRFSFDLVLDETAEPPVMTRTGTFVTTEYIEDIWSLQSEDYLLRGVHVFHESYGSEDKAKGYEFTFRELIRRTPEAKGAMTADG